MYWFESHELFKAWVDANWDAMPQQERPTKACMYPTGAIMLWTDDSEVNHYSDAIAQVARMP